MTTRKLFLALLALAVAVLAGDAIAGKSDRYGRQVITYEAPVVPGDAGTWTQPAPMPVEIQSGDGGLPVTQPKNWTVDSTACIGATVNTGTNSEDGGRLKAADTGLAESGKLYRCFNPSGSVGDICLRNNTSAPFSCSAGALAMTVAPGGEAWTMLTDPVMVTSSSGAASLVCCPVVY